MANEEYLERKLNEFEKANVNQKYQKVWSVINVVCGRKKSRAGRLQGNTKEKRIGSWYCHFKNLLGNPPEVLDEDEVIPMIFPELPIRTDAFDWDEYQTA